jgi:hypothetical protein
MGGQDGGADSQIVVRERAREGAAYASSVCGYPSNETIPRIMRRLHCSDQADVDREGLPSNPLSPPPHLRLPCQLLLRRPLHKRRKAGRQLRARDAAVRVGVTKELREGQREIQSERDHRDQRERERERDQREIQSEREIQSTQSIQSIQSTQSRIRTCTYASRGRERFG